MTQHESVDRFLSAESESRTDAVGEKLKSIVYAVRKQRASRAFPNHDGDFSAVLFVNSPQMGAQDFVAGSDVLHFKELRHAKAGDKRRVVILFAGQQLTQDYQADVTYDVKLINPDGKVFSDQKDLEGIKDKLPARFRVFNNKAAIFLSFDKEDKLGVYTVKVLLKDNVGKKTIPLTTTITLEK